MNHTSSEYHLTDSITEPARPRFLHFRTRGFYDFSTALGIVYESTERASFTSPQNEFTFSTFPNSYRAYGIGYQTRVNTCRANQILKIYFFRYRKLTRNSREQNQISELAITPDKSLARQNRSCSREDALTRLLQFEPSLLRFSCRPVITLFHQSHIWLAISIPVCLPSASAFDSSTVLLFGLKLRPLSRLQIRLPSSLLRCLQFFPSTNLIIRYLFDRTHRVTLCFSFCLAFGRQFNLTTPLTLSPPSHPTCWVYLNF